MRRASHGWVRVPEGSAWPAVLALLTAAAPALAAGSALRHDPFTRPGLRGPAATAAASRPAEATAGVLAAPWQPELRGVMLAGSASVANVGGTVIGLGESIDGWRLIRVEDGRATFVKAGQRTTLSMLNPGQPRP